MMEHRFSLRFAEPEDTALVLSLICELAEYENMSDLVVTDEKMLHSALFEQKAAEALIGEEDGVPVAFALFFHNFSTFVGRRGLYLEDVYIRPPYRGRGYGKTILKKLAALAVERGCGRMEWTCLDWNEPSIGFYLSLGAQPMSEWTVYRLSGDSLAALAAGIDEHREV